MGVPRLLTSLRIFFFISYLWKTKPIGKQNFQKIRTSSPWNHNSKVKNSLIVPLNIEIPVKCSRKVSVKGISYPWKNQKRSKICFANTLYFKLWKIARGVLFIDSPKFDVVPLARSKFRVHIMYCEGYCSFFTDKNKILHWHFLIYKCTF